MELRIITVERFTLVIRRILVRPEMYQGQTTKLQLPLKYVVMNSLKVKMLTKMMGRMLTEK